MREELAKRDGIRGTFRGTFVRFGKKAAYKGPPLTTVLLSPITDKQGKQVADHLWFNMTKAFDALDLQPGDVVEFDARIKPYWKGYRGRRDVWDKPVALDYKLTHPTKVRKVNGEASELPLFPQESPQ